MWILDIYVYFILWWLLAMKLLVGCYIPCNYQRLEHYVVLNKDKGQS